jgi:transposase-like protein
MRSEFRRAIKEAGGVPAFPGGVAELAHEAGISRQWLNKLIDQGKVQGLRRGRTGRLRITDNLALRLWLMERQDKNALKPHRWIVRDPDFVRWGISDRTRQIIWKIYHEQLPILEEVRDLPLAHALKIVHKDPEFRQFRCFPLFEWFSSARTHRSHELRESVFLYAFQPGGRLFDSMTEIAKKHEVTRSAVSKVFRQMIRIPGVPAIARGRKRTS